MAINPDAAKWKWLGPALAIALAAGFVTGLLPAKAIPYLVVAAFLWVAVVSTVFVARLTRSVGLTLAQAAFSLLLAWGGVAFSAFSAAEDAVPVAWEWPVGREVQALALADGQWAATHRHAKRIQLYDRDGRYMRGWYVPTHGGVFKVAAPSPDAIEVCTARGDNVLRYDLAGTLLAERSVGVDGYDDFAEGPFRPRRLSVAWYAWPLVSPFYAGLLVQVAFVGALLVFGRRLRAWKMQRDNMETA